MPPSGLEAGSGKGKAGRGKRKGESGKRKAVSEQELIFRLPLPACPFPEGGDVVEKIGIRDREFSREVTAQVKSLARCYQCSMCSDGCPVAYAMDYHPNQIIQLVRLGLKEKVLNSAAIWICASCETCATRCPNDIEIVRLMDVLRAQSLDAGYQGPAGNIPAFHKVFAEQIRKRGRIDEARLLINYELKTRGFLSFEKIREEAALGLEMFRKGKLKLPSMRKHSANAVKRIFKNVGVRR